MRPKLNGDVGATEDQLRLFVMQLPAIAAMLDTDMRWLAVSRGFLTDLKIDNVVDCSVSEMLPELLDHWKEAMRRCLAGSIDPCEGDSIVRVDGRAKWLRWVAQPWYTDSGELGGLLLASECTTERKGLVVGPNRSQKRLQAKLHALRRLHRLALLAETEADLHSLLTETVDAAIAITNADFGSIQLLDAGSAALRIVAQRGFPQWWVDFWNNAPEGQDKCGMGLCRTERIIVENVERSSVFSGACLDVVRKAHVHAVQSTPLVSRLGKAIGMLSTHYRVPRSLDAHALQLLDLLAREAALSIEHAQQTAALRESEERLRALNEELEQRVAERTREIHALQGDVLNIAMLEQRRIGQELHDGIQQELTGLGLLAQTLEDKLGHQGARVDAELAQRICNGIAQANLHIRELAHGLIPVPLDAETLPAALAGLAKSTQQSYPLSCRFDCPASVQVRDADTATHLYRIAQEAVGNAVRHSGADALSIRLAEANGELRLEISDNGVGIEQCESRVGGVGLRIMQYRCNLIGGHFIVAPRPGSGTVVGCAIETEGS